MLTYDELVELYLHLIDEPVLSIYLDTDQHDPAERGKWRTRVESLVGACRREVERTSGGAEALEAAWTRLEDRLQAYDSFVPGRGWVGFATPDRLCYADDVSVPMTDLVRWEKGIRVAPYLRGLKRNRPVVVVLADRKRARLFEFSDDRGGEVGDLRADTSVGDLTDVGVSKRSSRSTGTRGETATDQAQRILDVGTERMVKELVGTLGDHLGNEAVLVVGGTPETVSRLVDALPKALRPRVFPDPSMHVDMSLAEVRSAVESDVSQLTQQGQGWLLDQVVDEARAHGRGSLGLQETIQALQDKSVDTLLLSRNFISRDPDLADHLVGLAFIQSAGGEELGGTVGERLDQEGGGVAARLRFRSQQEDEEVGQDGG
jgi:hypothetical protein